MRVDATVVYVDDVKLSSLHNGKFLEKFQQFGVIEQLFVLPSTLGKARVEMKFDSVKIAREAREYVESLKI